MDFKRHFSWAVVILLLFAAFTSTAQGAEINANLEFDIPQIKHVDGCHRIMVENGKLIEQPGSPLLPSMGVWMLLPPGHRAIKAELANEVWKKLPGEYKIEPAGFPHRLSDPNPPKKPEPNPEIYEGDKPYPQNPINALATHLKWGMPVSTCLVYPVRWNPSNGTIEYLTSADLNIQTEQNERELDSFNRFFRGDKRSYEWARNRVENPEMLGQFPRRDDGEAASMLLVTVDDFTDIVSEYVTWRNLRGMTVHVRTVDELTAGQNGRNAQERLRNGIIDAYEELGVIYLLFFGDDEHIPHKGLWSIVNNSPDPDIAADIYFAGLDGDWNEDADAEWGEYEEADFLTELFVGRLTASDEADAERLLNKIYLYSDEPVIEDMLNVLMVGEELGWENMGGDYMDEVYDGCELYGYRTVGFPERYDDGRTNIYDRDGAWNPVNRLAPTISEGNHFLHHLGHSNVRGTMKFNAGQINNNLIQNDGVEHTHNIAWSQGCYSGSFDNRTTNPNEYIDDCIAEVFTAKIDNGFVAYLANSRYGWGSGNNTNGASQHFHREFVDAMYDENYTIIGETNQDSKEDCTPWTQHGVIRWCYFEINLFGDPAMDMWTDLPIPIEPEFERRIVIGDSTYSIQLDEIANAVVCLSRDGEQIAVGVTDDDGLAVLEIEEPILPPGRVDLKIIAHDFLPFDEVIYSVRPDYGYPYVEELEIVDLNGIEDGQADPGETIEINPVVQNLGQGEIARLDVTMETDDRYVRVLANETTYQNIEGDSEAISADPLVIELLPGCPDLHEIAFNLLFDNNDGHRWRQEVSLTTHAAIINDQIIVIDDSENGDNNGRLDPGEEAEVQIALVNSGTGRARNLNIEISSGNPFVEVIEGRAQIDMLEPNCINEPEGSFQIVIDEECPNPNHAVLYVQITSEFGATKGLLANLNIGGAYYAFDRNEEIWEHENLRDNHGDQWHISDEANHTHNGSHSVKAGSENADEDYAEMLNCALYMPEFEVEGPVQLLFWHKMDAEISRAHEGYAYDGGFLEASADNGEWELIYPETGVDTVHYPYKFRRGESPSPMIQDHPCFSGHHDWEPAIFDLSEFEGGNLQIRFRFASDGGTNDKGWFIDDVELILPLDLISPENLDGEIVDAGAELTWDTPVIPRDDLPDMNNELIGYRLYRGSADWIMIDTLITQPRFFDDLSEFPNGEVIFMVTAEYTLGESQPSNFLFLNWYNSTPASDENLPEEWAITGAYPNPFNAAATISYSVPVQGEVLLSVYDHRGRFVQELFNGPKTTGNHQAVFKAFDRPSGIYIVRMSTPVGNRFKRMVLIK